MIVLETKNLTKQFGGLTAVNAVSMTLYKGDVMGLIGPNGAGKTTFINAITGLNPPTSGDVIFFGENTTGLPPEKMCRKGISRTFQIPSPFPKMSAIESVMTATVFGNPPGTIKDPVAHSRKMLEFVEFPMSEDVISEQLNTVQLKRLDLARALASNPKVLFMDEMASGLSEGELLDIMKIIRKITGQGISILMVEHIMQLIMAVCNRLLCIQFGTKIAEGPKDEVANDPKVTKAYLGSNTDEKNKAEELVAEDN
ncbi:ABC transporter ATP-binding protein [Desulfamplus magnetovallimortis]|nr:ABC transporter ATP-binding protein [Desulfamplus magnetovallimortis]